MEHNVNIGQRIRHYRQLQGITLKALAEKVGITSSMLSQIERDLANPSINTLKLISSALNIPLFQFFTTSNPQEDLIVRKDSRKALRTPTATASYEYELLTPDTNGSIEFVLQKFKANSDSGDAVQTHGGEEVAYVVSGQLLLTLDQTEFMLYSGDSARIPAMTPHIWSNPTNDDAVLIFAVTPPCF